MTPWYCRVWRRVHRAASPTALSDGASLVATDRRVEEAGMTEPVELYLERRHAFKKKPKETA